MPCEGTWRNKVEYMSKKWHKIWCMLTTRTAGMPFVLGKKMSVRQKKLDKAK